MSLAGLLAAPTFAQEAEREKTDQELLEELHQLMKKASDEMGGLERELAKASLDAPKADVIAERVQRIRKAMEQGKLDDLPEGLSRHIADNPEELAKASGKSVEEIRRIADDSKQLEELLKQNPELLKKMAQNQDTMESIQRRQHDAEKKLEETLKKQREAARAADESVDKSINLAHMLKQQGQGQGQGQPKDNQQKTDDPRQGKEQQQGSGDPKQNATGQYQPGEGKLDQENETGDFVHGKGDSAQMEKKQKEMGDAASSDETRAPDKYKGFFRKWHEQTAKRAEEKKKQE
jgi:hypothetical protein